jgi:UDP-N-acetylmuramate: L-alanyl-gamma-D-glutamyl-meso-diaminopimelate ligase
MPMTVCFEPRSNTAVTSRFQAEFTAAFGAADRVYLGPLYRAERLNGEDRLDTARIAEALPAGKAFDCHKDIFVQLERDLRAGAGGLIVFFTNGGFEGLPRRIAALAAEF